MKLPIPDLEAAMFDARETSYDKAVDKYIQDHPDQVKSWLGEKADCAIAPRPRIGEAWTFDRTGRCVSIDRLQPTDAEDDTMGGRMSLARDAVKISIEAAARSLCGAGHLGIVGKRPRGPLRRRPGNDRRDTGGQPRMAVAWPWSGTDLAGGERQRSQAGLNGSPLSVDRSPHTRKRIRQWIRKRSPAELAQHVYDLDPGERNRRHRGHRSRGHTYVLLRHGMADCRKILDAQRDNGAYSG